MHLLVTKASGVYGPYVSLKLRVRTERVSLEVFKVFSCQISKREMEFHLETVF